MSISCIVFIVTIYFRTAYSIIRRPCYSPVDKHSSRICRRTVCSKRLPVSDTANDLDRQDRRRSRRWSVVTWRRWQSSCWRTNRSEIPSRCIGDREDSTFDRPGNRPPASSPDSHVSHVTRDLIMQLYKLQVKL